MKKRLEALKGTALKDISKALGLKGVSGLVKADLIDELAKELKKPENKDFDLSKYEQPVEETPAEESVVSAPVKVNGAKRRSIIPGTFGRR